MLIDITPRRRKRSWSEDDALEGIAETPLQRSFRGKADDIRDTVARMRDKLSERTDASYSRFAEDIETASAHLSQVLDGLGSAKSNRSSSSSFDLPALLSEVARLVGPAAAKRDVAVELKGTDLRLPRAKGNLTRARQALLNVVTNALKFTPDGEPILIEAEQGPGLLVVVSDCGPGIAAGDRERVFERFERLPGSQQGMGLGLSISRDYLRDMGGDLYAADGRCGGATFVLEFAPV